MLDTSYPCVRRVERKIEDSEANQRLITERTHCILRAGVAKEEGLVPEPRGWSWPAPTPQRGCEGGTNVTT